LASRCSQDYSDVGFVPLHARALDESESEVEFELFTEDGDELFISEERANPFQQRTSNESQISKFRQECEEALQNQIFKKGARAQDIVRVLRAEVT
jgi:hypothetical protein